MGLMIVLKVSSLLMMVCKTVSMWLHTYICLGKYTFILTIVYAVVTHVLHNYVTIAMCYICMYVCMYSRGYFIKKQDKQKFFDCIVIK